MQRNHRSVAGLILLCAACSRTPAPAPSVSEPLAPGTPERFTGELVLLGALARATDGAVEVSVRPIGSEDAIWSRSYEVRDPWWTTGPNRRSLPFGISKADSVDAADGYGSGKAKGDAAKSDADQSDAGKTDDAEIDRLQPLAREMEVVVRFDSDGDPDTHQASDVELVTRARTGATDLVLTLGGPPADLHPGPDLSKTSGALASPVEARHPR